MMSSGFEIYHNSLSNLKAVTGDDNDVQIKLIH